MNKDCKAVVCETAYLTQEGKGSLFSLLEWEIQGQKDQATCCFNIRNQRNVFHNIKTTSHVQI